MHPIVIMAYDKSPAINKAVAALEEAGMEVRVLNTRHAKLAEFLGALAGEDDELEDDTPPPTEDEPTPDEDTPPEDTPTEDEPELATESVLGMLNGEPILIEAHDGPSELHPNGLMIGAKTAYAINEAHFSFWPASSGEGLFDLVHQVQVEINGSTLFTDIMIKEATEKPVLKLNREQYALLKPQGEEDASSVHPSV
jgi:hypothetical protein